MTPHIPTLSPLSLWADDWAHAHEEARIFAWVLKGEAISRKALVQKFALRSTSVSEWVAHLLHKQLLSEVPSSAHGRGRPSLTLVANPHRYFVEVFLVISQSLHGFCVNLAGQTLAHEMLEVDPASENQDLIAHFRALDQLLIAKMPRQSECLGKSFSLSGLVDTQAKKWLFASRWSAMKDLDILAIFPDASDRVWVSRLMDAELRCRLSLQSGSTLLLHWGYGIGMAFGQTADTIAQGDTGFGEIGHWPLEDATDLCRCGARGCLETRAALWALGEPLLGKAFSLGSDEEYVGVRFQSMDLLREPSIVFALDEMLKTAIRICRIFFPARLIVSGPFVANAALWHAFVTRFHEENAFVAQKPPELIADQRSRDFALMGALMPAMKAALPALLASSAL